MGLETATYISDLNSSNPTSSDAKSAGDDHIRLLKSTVKSTFPNVSGAVTPTHTELNYVDGVTSAIQTQIDTKGSHAGQVWTGTHNFSSSVITIGAATLSADVDAGAHKITNLANATNSGDAANLQTVQALVSGGGTPANIPVTSIGVGTATAYQTLRINAAGTAIEGRPGWLRKTTTYTAVSFDRIKASTTGGAWSLTFPASPADGDEIEIQDVDGSFNSNNLTILPNGKKVMGDAASFVCNTRCMRVTFVYDATLSDWRF